MAGARPSQLRLHLFPRFRGTRAPASANNTVRLPAGCAPLKPPLDTFAPLGVVQRRQRVPSGHGPTGRVHPKEQDRVDSTRPLNGIVHPPRRFAPGGDRLERLTDRLHRNIQPDEGTIFTLGMTAFMKSMRVRATRLRTVRRLLRRRCRRDDVSRSREHWPV